MKDKLIPVENQEGLYRDPKSGAIVNNNTSAYVAYKMKKSLAEEKRLKELNQEREINSLKREVNSLNEKTDKILDLLEKLANGNS